MCSVSGPTNGKPCTTWSACAEVVGYMCCMHAYMLACMLACLLAVIMVNASGGVIDTVTAMNVLWLGVGL